MQLLIPPNEQIVIAGLVPMPLYILTQETKCENLMNVDKYENIVYSDSVDLIMMTLALIT